MKAQALKSVQHQMQEQELGRLRGGLNASSENLLLAASSQNLQEAGSAKKQARFAVSTDSLDELSRSNSRELLARRIQTPAKFRTTGATSAFDDDEEEDALDDASEQMLDGDVRGHFDVEDDLLAADESRLHDAFKDGDDEELGTMFAGDARQNEEDDMDLEQRLSQDEQADDDF